MEFSTTYQLPCGSQQVLDMDANESGGFIALLDNSEVLTNDGRILLDQSFQFPLIRRLDAERFLIIEARHPAPNGHIFDKNGNRVTSFDAGDGVEDVLVQAGRIIIAYFDEGVLTGRKPAADGLAVFDTSGNQQFGYNANHAPFLLDCYGMCRWGNDRILVYPYPEAPILDLRLTDYRLQRLPMRERLEWVTAISVYRGEVVYYVSPSGKASYFEWQKDGRIQRYYVAAGQLRSLDHGHFLSYDATSFTVFDAAAALHLDE